MQPVQQKSPISALPAGSPLFDRERKFEMTIPHPDGAKTIVVRYPTDEEWFERIRHQTTIVRSLGRDATKRETKGELESARELLYRISIGESRIEDARFDEYEAALIIGRLAFAEVTEVLRQGTNYAITMNVLGAQVIHYLRIPTQRQIHEYNRGSVQATGKRNSTEVRVSLEPTRELWRGVVAGIEGYVPHGYLASVDAAGAEFSSAVVPVVHMDAALNELLAQVNSDIEGGISSSNGTGPEK